MIRLTGRRNGRRGSKAMKILRFALLLLILSGASNCRTKHIANCTASKAISLRTKHMSRPVWRPKYSPNFLAALDAWVHLSNRALLEPLNRGLMEPVESANFRVWDRVVFSIISRFSQTLKRFFWGCCRQDKSGAISTF